MTSHSLPAAWSHLPFFKSDWPRIQSELDAETRQILPPNAQRFAALDLTSPADTHVVILGQDPYPTPGHAHGLAFSVEPNVRPLPRSLSNIHKELEADLNISRPNGDLRGWAKQGVLLLNTALSVPAGEADGHKRLGWAPLVHQILEQCSARPTAFILWGNTAQKLAKFIQGDTHLILKSAHPSPLSARRGFFGSRPFSNVNDWLTQQGHPPIDWSQ
ncbi:uracil-DNA glycosylase [Epibacterium sp. SM1979]|uniref:Uracil-DNA glycosylase n=1 Tax=Tritonibacter litoralis TaxID=2662264 RepID=A0A843YCH7_9RHOB|nr:uracil-DNA glycosylase [Tritonibacter litoralis]MQQ07033.1 uracil-DNA glycosylase [Tritonibacter litoralis]